MVKFLTALLLVVHSLSTANQTDTVSPILPPDSLPFTISIVQADFQLPSDDLNSVGLQSFVYGVNQGKWLLITGRIAGLHGFGPSGNFLPDEQNRTVYVVDPQHKTVVSRSLTDASAGLSQAQIDTLSVSGAEFCQVGNTLYVVGGYGIDTPSGQFTTKSTLTAIDIPGLIQWVEGGKMPNRTIRQTSHPLLQVTGGYLSQTNGHEPFLLVLGQNFVGDETNSSNGLYTEQVRPFRIIDNGHSLYIQPGKSFSPNPNYRRADLNVVPIIQKRLSYETAFVALSGVFTEDGGIWTVPILIQSDGSSLMPDPSMSSTFKQGMNNYVSANATLFSKNNNEMYILLFGGLSYEFVNGGVIEPDSELPFINSVTTIKIDSSGSFCQYLMDGAYPVILSDFVNPGNPLLFGTSGQFIPAGNLPAFSNGVVSLDALDSSILLGYIVGGIQSSVPNTSSSADSAASPYIFSVLLQKR